MYSNAIFYVRIPGIFPDLMIRITPRIYSICHEIWNQTFQGGILLHMKIYDQCRLQSHAHKTKSISYHKN